MKSKTSTGDIFPRLKSWVFSPNVYKTADELEIVIVHTPSNAIISKRTFTP